MKVAIVCDWIIGGGAEKVVEQLHKMYPDAPIYTSYCTEEWRKRLNNKVITGYLQKGPFPKLRKFIPFLRGWWFASLDLKKYDLVISSSGAEAKYIKTKPSTKHIAYIHAPTHYYWNRYEEYMAQPGFGFFDPLARLGLKVLVGPMRRWDYKAAQRPNFLIANSTFTKAQIKKYYQRDSIVIYPPVEIEIPKLSALGGSSKSKEGFIIVGRQTPYKRFDLAVAACTNLNLPLTIIGHGPDHNRLTNMAGPTIKFIRVKNNEVPKYLAAASAFIFPGLDDFGIAPVEALAVGTPVIAFHGGGALDYVQPGKTGEFFNEQTVESLSKALHLFDPQKFKSNVLIKKAAEFSPSVFENKISSFIKQNIV